jgi:hypothetical protein
MNDPASLEDARRPGLEILDPPRSGRDGIVQQLYATAPEIIRRYQEIRECHQLRRKEVRSEKGD